MLMSERNHEIKEADKGKKLSPKTDDKRKDELNEHNLTKESRDFVGPPNRTLTVTFKIKPKLTRLEDLTEAYKKFAMDLNYNRTSWYALPDVSQDAETVKLIFDGERDLALFQQRLEEAHIHAAKQEE